MNPGIEQAADFCIPTSQILVIRGVSFFRVGVVGLLCNGMDRFWAGDTVVTNLSRNSAVGGQYGSCEVENAGRPVSAVDLPQCVNGSIHYLLHC